ncbi:MAG TPA: carboxypeptidase-like regulatory domain-containing protein [Mucilaginibacter sp.]|jgi:hypothetical protein
MKRVLIFAFLSLSNCAFIFAQNSFKGIVTDADSGKAIPYVSIGIVNKVDGTVSNADGEFKINLNIKVSDDDTLKFSSIGYQSKAFLLGDLKKKYKDLPLNVSLKKAVNQLKQVVINSKRANEKILGYPTTSKLLGLGFGTNSIGSQAGVRIPIKHENTNIENLSFFIIQNSFEQLTFRVNIYEMNNGKPGNNILNENVIVKVGNKQTGKITFDLTPYNIYTDKDVLVSMEWIEAKPAATGTLDVGAVIFGSTYFKQASQYQWAKKGTGLGIGVKVNY